ncbi:MAG TPA: hypothetical protein VEG25_10605 [Burkholderiales bacterium]|nr:hypothetical protein [Burkholderiales bacterium]
MKMKLAGLIDPGGNLKALAPGRYKDKLYRGVHFHVSEDGLKRAWRLRAAKFKSAGRIS